MEGYVDVNDIIESWNQNDFTSDERFKFWCLLNDLKRIDIVRCKDCTHYKDKCCITDSNYREEDFYCAAGRKV